MENIFKASVQYNDFKGSSAADEADFGKPAKWLKSNGYIDDGEYIVGIEFFAGENHGEHKDPVYVRFLVLKLEGYDNIPEQTNSIEGALPVRKIDVQMKLLEFFGLFKRFNVTLSLGGKLEGRDIKYIE